MQTLSMEPTYRVVLPAVEGLTVILVGVGGTGSALALSLGRLAYHLKTKGVRVQMLFVDHDTVEAKNIGRQLFSPSEIGANKAEALAFRLNAAFGLDISAAPIPFTAARFEKWASGCGRQTGANLLISAVDNHLARREIARAMEAQNGRWFCLDLGNEHQSGQVLLGNATKLEMIRFDRLGLCTGLPSPYVQEPALLAPPETNASPLSCADLALLGDQSLVVNQMVAALAAQYCYQFLLRRELRQMATTFTLEPPFTQSTVLTQSNIESSFR